MSGPKTQHGMLRKDERKSINKEVGTGTKTQQVMRDLRAVLSHGPAELGRLRKVFARYGIRAALAARIMNMLPRTMRMRFYVRELQLPMPKRLVRDGVDTL